LTSLATGIAICCFFVPSPLVGEDNV